MALNHIVLQGRLTKVPELRYTQTGTAVASFTVAVDRDYTREKETDFINITAWKQTGEFVSRYFDRGDMIVVSGRLQIRSYTDRNGANRTAAEVVAEHCYFCGSRKKADDDMQPVYTELDDGDGELPF